MSIRITGLYSGLDTDSMVKDLTSAYSTKKDNIQKQQTSLEWKKEQWEELNKDIYTFYTDSLSYGRYGNNTYEVTYEDNKVVSINNPNKNNVGVHNFQVQELAQSGYLTGKQLDKTITEKNQIKDLLKRPHVGGKITVNGKVIEVTEDMTVGDLAVKIAEAGKIHANFDDINHRMYLSSLQTGKDNDFTLTSKNSEGEEILKALGLTGEGATRIEGKDAILKFNGVTYINNTNNFNINGLSIEAKSTSPNPVTVSINKSNNLIMDTVTKFVDSYNELLEKMQTLYNKKSSKTYAPLSDKEKEALTEKEIEKWEKTGKENILSKDNSLRTIINLFKDSTLKTYNINGEKLSLASIGLSTGSYFSTGENKRGTLEINKDKLEKAINDDPEKVIQLIKAVSSDLYDKLDKNSKSSSLKSVYKFYNDKELNNKIKDYDKKIKEWEEKTKKMEEKYYKQFSNMETMLSKIQSNSSYLTNLFNF